MKLKLPMLIDCQTCRAHLPDYVHLELNSQPADQSYPEIVFHLETCSECEAAYYREFRAQGRRKSLAELQQIGQRAPIATIMQQIVSPSGADPGVSSAQNLSSLSEQEASISAVSQQILWQLNELGRLVIEFSAELIHAFQPPAYATAGLKSDAPQRILVEVPLKNAVEDLEVTITAKEERDDPAHCTVTVEVNIPSRGGWPNLADTEVTLKQGKYTPETQTTNAFGMAVFEGIATANLPQLVFEIRPGEGEM